MPIDTYNFTNWLIWNQFLRPYYNAENHVTNDGNPFMSMAIQMDYVNQINDMHDNEKYY